MVEGEALLTRHASSENGTRSFCSRCGTSLFCESTLHAEHVDIPLANMEDEIDRTPSSISTSTATRSGSRSTTACLDLAAKAATNRSRTSVVGCY